MIDYTKEELVELLQKYPEKFNAVSYTHLDVYKRQLLVVLIVSKTKFLCVRSEEMLLKSRHVPA